MTEAQRYKIRRSIEFIIHRSLYDQGVIREELGGATIELQRRTVLSIDVLASDIIGHLEAKKMIRQS